MCWFCGEYLIPRIGITLIGIFVIVLCCLSCCPVTTMTWFEIIKGCINACLYKKAKIVPIPMAITVPYHNRTSSIAHEVPTAEVLVVL